MLGPSLLALLSGAGLGATDYFGGRQTARHGAVRVLIAVQTAGLVALLVAAAVTRSWSFTPPLLGLAAGAGAFEIVGTAALYFGLARGRAALVAPAAALAPAVPAAFEVITEGGVGVLTIAGAVVAVAGVVIVAAVPSPDTDDGSGTAQPKRGGIAWGLLAAAGFGGYLTLIALASAEGGAVSALLIDRATAWSVVAALGLVLVARGHRPRWSISTRDSVALTIIGVGIAASDLAYAISTTLGDLTIAAILSSTHPVFTVLFARLFGAEKVGTRRWVGIAVTAVGSVLVSLS